MDESSSIHCAPCLAYKISYSYVFCLQEDSYLPVEENKIFIATDHS